MGRNKFWERLQMSSILIKKVTVKNNPVQFCDPFIFEIEYECLCDLSEDLEWRLVYVGSSEDMIHDQELERIYLGPISQGSYRLELSADAPNKLLIPRDELIGASAVLITCYYKKQEFIRIGFFVSVDFIDDDEAYRFDNDKNYIPDEQFLARHILADKAIVTRFPVDFEC